MKAKLLCNIGLHSWRVLKSISKDQLEVNVEFEIRHPNIDDMMRAMGPNDLIGGISTDVQNRICKRCNLTDNGIERQEKKIRIKLIRKGIVDDKLLKISEMSSMKKKVETLSEEQLLEIMVHWMENKNERG